MATKTPLELVIEALADFEQHGTRDEKKSAVPVLRRLTRKTEIQLLELLDQRLMLTQAEGTRDRDTLRDLAEFSQHEEIRTWSLEILNPKPRTPGFLGMGAVRV
jgi:hypothetical protein